MKFLLFSLITSLAAVLFYHSSIYHTALIYLSPLTALLASVNNPSSSSHPPLFTFPFTPPSFFASHKAANMSAPRAIRQVFLAIEQSEGMGARVRRTIGTPKLRNFSPFLMLDHFTSSPGAGFPDHPHRGQETITYLLHGAVDHEDFAGNRGTIEAGGLQFMTAGKGIMHAEMPRQNPDGSPTVGMQLWVDLPEKLKMCEPRYRDLAASDVPTIEVDDKKVEIKIISGQSHGTDSVKELAYTPVWIFDIAIRPGGKVSQPLPTGWNAFAYTLEGSTIFGSRTSSSNETKTTVEKYHTVEFEQKGDLVSAEVLESAKESGRFSKYIGSPKLSYL